MLLKYDEALKQAENPDWFRGFYKKEDLASDEDVDNLNALVRELGEEVLFDYFEIKEDMVLPAIYVDDLYDYLEDLKENAK